MLTYCPYCSSRQVHAWFTTELPLFTWPLPPGRKNPLVPTTVSLCKNCLYAFNSSPLNDKELSLLYDNYVYVSPAAGIGFSSHATFIDLVKKRLDKNANIVEIGCSDGYLLSVLHKEGYRNLFGLDPTPRISNDFPIPVRKEYFTRDTLFEFPIDAFILEHVFEHFTKPWEILDNMASLLPTGGKVLIEVPYYCNGIHHQHLSFFTPPFLQTIAANTGLDILELTTDKVVTRVVFQKNISLSPFYTSQELESQKNEVFLQTSEVERQRQELHSRLDDFVRSAGNEPVYWWGTGSSSAILFAGLDPVLKKTSDFKILDSDPARKCLIFSPAEKEVLFAPEVLKKLRISNLVFASQFSGEMRAIMTRIDCTAEKTFQV